MSTADWNILICLLKACACIWLGIAHRPGIVGLCFFIWKEKLFSSDVTEPVERTQQDPESHGPN